MKPYYLLLCLSILLISGCASYGVIHNSARETIDYANTDAICSASQAQRTGDISLMLAFSGGGTRAADKIIALSGGNVVKMSYHQELPGKGGLYSQLYCRQHELSAIGADSTR